MQLTWHINKHCCNIYAWVQLSKWKVQNTMLENFFLLNIERKTHQNLLLYVILKGSFKHTLCDMYIAVIESTDWLPVQ